MIKILVKKLSKNIKLPDYKTVGSSGMDLIANLDKNLVLKSGEKKIIPSGISVAVPKNYEIQIRPRSGLAFKYGITVLNSPGTIDSDYRGEIKVILINLGKKKFIVKNGERIAQMILCPVAKIKFHEVNMLPNTTRGKGGFGSTGR